MKKFEKYIPGQTDTETQLNRRLDELQSLILKLYIHGIEMLTLKELEEYVNMDIEKVKETKVSEKTIIIAEETKRFLIENKEEVKKRIEERQIDEER